MGLIKMAKIVVTFKIMPKNVKIDFSSLEKGIEAVIKKHSDQFKSEKEPIAFGLTALKFTFVWDEAKGGTDQLEKEVKKVKGVASVDVIDVRRAIG